MKNTFTSFLSKSFSAFQFSVLILVKGLIAEETWRARWNYARRWLKHARQYAVAGSLLTNGPICYEHEWQVQGAAPIDEMVNWLRRAVNLAPKMEGCGFAICLDIIERKPIRLTSLLRRSFFLHTQSEAENQLRDVLTKRVFDKQTLNLGLFSGAVFSGKPLRSLPD